jgi:hypothetical protein
MTTKISLTPEPEAGDYVPDGATDEQLELLAADTPEDEIHNRALTAKNGAPVMRDGQPITLDYVTARFVQDRLDSTVGPARWQSVFESLATGAVRCGLGILIQRNESAEWVWKYDVGVPSLIEPDKGAHSDSFKRAGVQWGIARDLYDDRDADREQPAAVAADAPPRRTITQQVAGQDEAPVASGTEPWACPNHNEVRVVPGGLSKRTGRKYNAFYACPVPGCDEKGPSV